MRGSRNLLSFTHFFNVSIFLIIFSYFRMFVRHIPQQISTKPSGPFGLDMELLERIESTAPVKCRNPVLLEPNLDDLNDTIHIKLQPNQLVKKN